MAGKSILKVLFTLTHLSPLIQSVVPAATFIKLKTKHNFCTEVLHNWLGFSAEFLGNVILKANTYTSMSAFPWTFPANFTTKSNPSLNKT